MSCLVRSPSPCGRDCAACAGLLRRAVGLSRGCCAAAAPSVAAPSRGRGSPAWGRSAAPRGLTWARTMRPRGWSCLRAAPCSPTFRGRKNAPAALVVAACRCALRRLGARRPAPLSSAAVLPAAADSRCAVSIQQSCIPASRSPAAKLHQNALEKHKKASKSPLFVRHIAASVTERVNRQYAKKPRIGGFLGSC